MKEKVNGNEDEDVLTFLLLLFFSFLLFGSGTGDDRSTDKQMNSKGRGK